MRTAFRGVGVVSIALLSIGSTGNRIAAQPGWAQGTRYAPSPGYLGEYSPSPYYQSFVGYAFNGMPPRYYSSYASGNLPTYLTSINYPTIYGAYGYPFAPGRFVYSATPGDFTTAPTIYGVYSTETNAAMSLRTIPDTAQTPLRTTATVNVVFPADAELTFQGVSVGQTGVYRRYVTPPLVPVDPYTYDIRATWREGSQLVTRDRHIDLQAGDLLTVDLLSPAPAPASISTLRARPNR